MKANSAFQRLLLAISIAFLSTGCGAGGADHIQHAGFVTGADSASLYYRVMGSGQDTVVVIHGGPGAGMNTVIPMIKPLAENHVLVFYDQRGGGKSTLPSDTTRLRPRYFVEDLESVRRHFGLKRMNVLAHSFGSVLVANYAKQYPERLKRIVFHGATGPRLEDALHVMQAKAAVQAPSPDTALSKKASRLLDELLRGAAADPVATCREYEAINNELAALRGDPPYRATTCNAPAEAVHYYYRYTAQLAPRYYGSWDFTTGLDRVSAALLVVYGKQDTLAHPPQHQWASAVPNGGLLLVPDAGKAAFFDNPEFAIAAVDTFFNGVWPDGTELFAR